ncbi:hypothetical protein DW884_14765 [Ruminococcus sp. AM40-10AC]|nr:hypothetical protein DW884_14765 [Ruminococcus sp. AM40-10AC]
MIVRISNTKATTSIIADAIALVPDASGPKSVPSTIKPFVRLLPDRWPRTAAMANIPRLRMVTSAV